MRLGGSVKSCTLPCGSQTWRPPSPPRPPRPGPVQSGSDYPNVVSKVRPDQSRARCALMLWGGLRGVHLRARAGLLSGFWTGSAAGMGLWFSSMVPSLFCSVGSWFPAQAGSSGGTSAQRLEVRSHPPVLGVVGGE